MAENTQQVNQGQIDLGVIVGQVLERLSSLSGEERDKIMGKVASGEYDSYESFVGDLASLQNLPEEDQQYLKEREELIRERGALLENKKDFTNVLGATVNSVQALSDIRDAQSQLDTAKGERKASKRPSRLRPYQKSPELQEAIRRAYTDLSPSSLAAQTEGLTADAAQAYRGGLEQAKQASTGQAGAYGSYAQSAAQNRFRNALQIQELRNRLRNDTNRNLNYLIQNQIGENQSADVNARFRSQQDLEQYNAEQRAAGLAEQAGMYNRRLGMTNLLSASNDYLPEIAYAKADDPVDFPIPNQQQSPSAVGTTMTPPSVPQQPMYGGRMPIKTSFYRPEPVVPQRKGIDFAEPLVDFSTDESLLNYNPMSNFNNIPQSLITY